MSDKKNYDLIINEESIGRFETYDEVEALLQEQLEEELSDLEFLKSEELKIGNKDELGEIIKNIIWEQFINQIAVTAGEDFIKENNDLKLDLRNEKHIQTSENFEKGIIASHNTKIDYKNLYDDYIDSFQKDETGKIKVDSKGNKILTKEIRSYYDEGRDKGSSIIHKDHTISVAEIVRDVDGAIYLGKEKSKEFANSDTNLKDLDASANMSKSDKSMTEWLDYERNGQKPSERFNIDEKELRERDKISREEYEKIKEDGREKAILTGRESQKKEAIDITGKAFRSTFMVMLSELLKKIISKLIKWFKSENKNIDTLIESIKDAIVSFVSQIKTYMKQATTTFATTVITSIIGPIVSTIKKVWILLKQGWKSLKEAIEYIKNPENRNKPISVLIFEVGKIVIAGLTGMGAIVLGEVIEKGLMTIPIFAINIPLIGSIANILGIFMGAVVSGIIGAIAMDLIDKAIAKKLKVEIGKNKIDKQYDILNTQSKINFLSYEKMNDKKKYTCLKLNQNQNKLNNMLIDHINKVWDDAEPVKQIDTLHKNKYDFDKMEMNLKNLSQRDISLEYDKILTILDELDD